tara:strand:+ start:106 stop:963 length:858 start_codon:yes stop_codon:yes gene_type:complete
MIIWLASYPKSGNTWIRSFLNSLLFTKSGEVNLNKLTNIYQFPVRSQFKDITSNLDDLKELSKNWIIAQEKINKEKKVKIFKTHNGLYKIEGNSFTDTNNTLGVIYVVRDPRSVITSILYHYQKKDYNEAKEFMFEENQIIGRNFAERKKNYKDIDIITLISSWKNHYNSWKRFPKNYLLVKYEDLIKNPIAEFRRIETYLSNILKVKFDKNKVKDCINNNSFYNLKKIEEKKGFIEATTDRITNQKKKFFYLGPENIWQNLLSDEIRNSIENKFSLEMKELDYI